MGAMKTQVIHLDVHDDVISIRDKMSWAKADRILLVFPRRSRLQLRNLDLRLIRRHAAKIGAQLAFVTRSRELRRSAKEAGILAFRVIKTAQRKKWEWQQVAENAQRQAHPPDLWQMRREIYSAGAHWQERPAVRVTFFSLAVLIITALLLLFIPSASIQLTLATKSQDLTISVNADPKVAGVNLTGSIPAHSATLFVEKNKTAKASGTIVVSGAAATGKVVFRNLTSDEIEIPSGTVLSTEDVPAEQFATTEVATLTGAAGKTVEVPVRAVEGGTKGNLPKDTLILIEGDLGASLAVTNPEPTTGGTDRKVLAPTSSDRNSLRDALQAEVLDGCKASFQETMGEKALFFPDTLKISQVVSEIYFPAEGQSGDTLSLTMNLQCQMEYASLDDLTTLAEMAMDVNLPAGYEAAPEGAIASASDVPKTDADGTTHWKMKTRRLLRNKIDEKIVLSLVQGQQIADANSRLEEALPLDKLPEIKMTPSWWPWLPIFQFRISVLTGE
jgi:hypothetical protein